MNIEIKGEDEIIRTYFAPLAKDNLDAFGLLDDCAILRPTQGTDLILSTDAIAEGIHFLRNDHPENIGWKALAVSVSDLAAKGAIPLVYQMALSFPTAPTQDFMVRFTKGLAEAQKSFGIKLSGGDSDQRPGPFSVTVTVIGEVPYNRMVARAGGGAGQSLFISGSLGEAALGLKLRRREKCTRFWNLDNSEISELERRYLRPTPRLDIRDILRQYATSSIDISDGLYKDLEHLSSASKCGAVIEIASLPLSPVVKKILKKDRELIALILTGGDDYEILFSVPDDKIGEVTRLSQSLGVRITKIGSLTKSPKIIVQDEKDNPMQVEKFGWDHFSP
ncbi:MAG: thiamine-phosphate kinase [Hyphomicrobium sp.]